ncbi:MULTISPECIES: helix-turn-helix domain-containing protein [Kocuria]|uniref:Excisionase n=2 Tax=Kocuria marina TaxID=223184 RepID=A0A0B0D6D5_9MICC|nr:MULTISPECIES: helix-turn-helix domain-containing protein [Kocuria]KHE73536.1 excisionase [Kocuria marina]MCT1615858.1 helix-turn-helix domain-containing protein [Kocuria marina]NDO77164.1 helix-turn-helix domain-containing protein [Kocuria indica]
MSQQRFLTLADVAEILSISVPQARAMVRSGELPAIQVGGRGQWRVEKVKLEEYIQQGYERTEQAVREGTLH